MRQISHARGRPERRKTYFSIASKNSNNWMDNQRDNQTDNRTDNWMDNQIDNRMDNQTDSWIIG